VSRLLLGEDEPLPGRPGEASSSLYHLRGDKSDESGAEVVITDREMSEVVITDMKMAVRLAGWPGLADKLPISGAASEAAPATEHWVSSRGL
jgi:hypothetical protein